MNLGWGNNNILSYVWAIIISLHFQLGIMGVKTISRILGKKTVKKSSAMDFFGVLKDSKNLEEMEKEILEERKKSGFRDVFA